MGVILGHGGLEVLEIDPRSTFVRDLAITALVLILFRDGLEVEAEMLQTAWHLPLRKLVLAMPITAAIVAACAKALTGLNWTEAFLLGALLSPTDPVLSSSVVTNPRVPRLVRHSLNLESGLNDGLALPPVLALTAALGTGVHFSWPTFVAQDVGLGLAYGIGIGLAASWLLPRERGLATMIPEHQRALYALGVAFLTYGTTVLPPHGNGFIAVFVCAIALGIRRPDIRLTFEHRADDLVEIVGVPGTDDRCAHGGAVAEGPAPREQSVGDRAPMAAGVDLAERVVPCRRRHNSPRSATRRRRR
jgi:NhaP-type Na+/H+ or K+/H+ antiporter